MKLRISQALSVVSSIAVFLTFSMVSLAADGKVMGEITVGGKMVNGQLPVVTVNGEAIQSGRTIFSSSRVSTSNESTATLNLGRIGTIQLSPNTELVVSFSEKGISGDLLSGEVSVLNAPADTVSFKTLTGTRKLNAGETASAANSGANSQSNTSAAGWWWAAILIGGAVGGILIAANSDNNRVALGGGTSVVSPTR